MKKSDLLGLAFCVLLAIFIVLVLIKPGHGAVGHCGVGRGAAGQGVAEKAGDRPAFFCGNPMTA